MARARIIKPGFFTNEDLLECDPLARILFAGLWCHGDRAGRIEDRPRKLKVLILPADNCDVEELLQQLARAGMILRYEANGVRYIQVLKFGKHQTPHVREAASTIPAPEGYEADQNPGDGEPDTSTVPAQDKHSASTRQDRLDPRSGIQDPVPGIPGDPVKTDTPVIPPHAAGVSTPRSLEDGAIEVPFSEPLEGPAPDEEPELLLGDTPDREREGDRAAGQVASQDLPLPRAPRLRERARPAPKPRRVYSDEFERAFWARYPNKVNKPAASDLFERARRGGVSAEVIAEGLGRYLASDKWARDGGRYVEAPDVWLRNGRWEDSPTPAKGSVVQLSRAQPGRPMGNAERTWAVLQEAAADVMGG